MVKAFSAFFSCYLITASCIAGAQPADCEPGSKFDKNLSELETVVEIAEECPAPTKQQFLNICHAIYVKELYSGTEPFSYEYQKKMWDISCANPSKDDKVAAKEKIQKMWNKYRESFTCDNYVDSLASERNITKFSIDRGFTAFVSEAVKKYNLDMNFKDTDGQTVLDFIKEQEELTYKQPPVDEYKIKEYKRLYDMLRNSGAKHAKEI